MIVDIAFAVVPTILGLGAAGLIGSASIRTAKNVMNSISLLKTVGPGLLYGTAMAGKGLNIGRKWIAERLQQSDDKWLQKAGNVLWKKNNQDTQGKRDGKGGGGGGNPPTPPEIKADKKEQNNEAKKPKRAEPSYGFSDSPLGLLLKRKDK
ncbi:MAG: hypothetical protein ACO2PP_06915 [Thermocrinis sp.]|jgi:hypothetical protein|uniref:hypothetical protein n=1 Tax=Thermocrinis sp. TaxID=2024383 RepID=UPI003C066F8C